MNYAVLYLFLIVLALAFFAGTDGDDEEPQM